ncbi:MAG: 2-C-methyl-D-erythritol 2,4-cyclodiphosphate synthase [Pirellulaceae bacterium]|nr:2-C-methyl-D-erythritol 2,4-cyclodiphosphate synthase [Pirellulaceae bacterium]
MVTLSLYPRIGIGHDTHRLGEGGPLRLGGVEVECDRHLVGHSDADVLLHAVTDALLGAISSGDIGELFPDTDDANDQRDSADFVLAALGKVQAVGFQVGNLDCVIHAQRPKLSAYKKPICHRLAELLQVPPEAVGVKAKTGELVGPVGRREAIVAQCVVLLIPACS